MKQLWLTGGSSTTVSKGVRNVIPHTRHVQHYDVATRSWTPGRPMLTARSAHAFAFCRNKVFAIGGMGK